MSSKFFDFLNNKKYADFLKNKFINDHLFLPPIRPPFFPPLKPPFFLPPAPFFFPPFCLSPPSSRLFLALKPKQRANVKRKFKLQRLY